jgi:hypothetical protein
MRTIRAALLAAVLFLPAIPAFAQPCSGFTDVSIGSEFCPNVDWLKNRSITLGCTSTTLYCPDDPVPRLQMAAFMNRLGNALTPVVVRVEQSGGALPSLATPQPVCESADQAITGFPRSFLVSGSITAKGAPDGDVVVQVVRNVDGGAYGSMNQVPQLLSLRTPVWNNVAVLAAPQPDPSFNINVGSTYRFALQILRPGGTTEVSSFQCHLILELRSRQGGTFPHDP